MVGTRRVFFHGSLDFIPDYSEHKELNSQRHYKRAVALFERLLGTYESLVLYGATLTYRTENVVCLEEVQAHLRGWIRALKDRDDRKRIVGITVTIEEGGLHEKLHAHVLIFARDWMVREELMWDMQELWEGVSTQSKGLYHNDNWTSEAFEREGKVGALGYIDCNNSLKIQQALGKIAYNTKDGYVPEEAQGTKKKCFICEEYE